MAQVIQLKDQSLHTVFGEQDILSLVEEKLGMEARQVLEALLFERSEDAEYIADLEQEAEEKKTHYLSVMRTLREQSEIIAGLISQREIDRRALSRAAGIIGITTGRELNRQ